MDAINRTEKSNHIIKTYLIYQDYCSMHIHTNYQWLVEPSPGFPVGYTLWLYHSLLLS
ncbi:hypothetical protein HanRHA438_Chr17g0821871 [Helianthus annuus]|nr:hypothetical protein HanRHA438_Chr17g0821871 [Helianthus annuus]